MDLAVTNWEDVDTLAFDPGMQGSTSQTKDELQQLLRFLRFRPEVDLPLTIRKGPDPPDFILASPTRTTGVEVTWAANERWEQSIAHPGTKNPQYDRVSRNCLEMTQKRSKELGKFIKEKQKASLFCGSIWGSREQAHPKAREVSNAIQRKTKSFSRPDYARFDQNWLLISDKNTFDFLDINEFSELVCHAIRQESIQHDALYFLTRLRGEDALFKISRSHCQVVQSMTGERRAR
jgi:hypothetical protein